MMVLGARRFYPRYFPQALREHFEIIFCDLRQWVPTPHGFDIGTITRQTFSDDIEAVRRATGLERPIVAGQSHHGTIALEYGRQFPEHVRGVLAIAANPPEDTYDGSESAQDFFQRDAGSDRLAAHERNLSTRGLHASVETSQDFVDNYVARGAMSWYDATFDSSPLWEGSELNVPVIGQYSKAFDDFSVEGIDVPVFLALGRYDYLTPHYLWDKPRQSLSNLRYKLYDKSAHQPPYEQPDEFTADVVEWASGL
jgi:proline iminopeptidase